MRPNRPSVNPFLLMTIFSLLLSPAIVLAEGGDVLWMFQGIEDIQAMAWLPDVNGDQIPEVVVETYDAGASGDHLYVLSGGDTSTPATIWSARPNSGASNGGGWGDYCLNISPDLSGDGFPDVLLGTAWGNRSVHVFDGINGNVLWTFDTYNEPDAGWVYAVAPHPDRTGDGKPEVIAAVGSENDTGYLLDGATGHPLWRFYGASDALGVAVSMPDVNDDEVPDVLFGAMDYDSSIYCVSGASEGVGQLLWSQDTGGSLHAAVIGDDVSGDGIGDVVTGNWGSTNQVQCRDATTGALRWSHHNGAGNYIMRLAMISDVDGDGKRDVAIGSFDRAVKVVSGKSGDLIWISFAGTLNGGDFWAIDRVDDIDGDGLDEVVGGSFDNKVYLFSGADGDTLWMYNTSRRLFTVRGGPDLSGNGVADVLAGTQYLTWGGRAFALEGGEDLTGVRDLPRAEGVARIARAVDSEDAAAGAADRVELSWNCQEDLPFNIYRLQEGKGNAVGRQLLIEAFDRKELRSRDVLETIVAQQEQESRLLTLDPVTSQTSGGDSWSYSYTDLLPDDIDPGNCVYRFAACMPGGGETVLFEVRPQYSAVPGPVISSASIQPNPFNPATRIVFELTRESRVTLSVHDVRGRLVETLPVQVMPAGHNEIRWPLRDDLVSGLASGVYLVTVSAGGESQRLRAVLVK